MIKFEHISQFDWQGYKNSNVLVRKKIRAIDSVSAFDIETSRLPEIEQSFMYVWQFAIEINGVIKAYYGRYWSEFRDFVEKLSNATNGCKQVIYVHNLAYEFSFLKGIFKFKTEDVMNLKSRSPLKATYKNIEFRCSYRHSNMSLDKFAKQMGAKHRKLKGGLDYNKVRYPWDHLSKKEWKYCIYDVVALVESIRNEMERDGDDLNTIPMTSTGYLRREAKHNIYDHDIAWIKGIVPSYDIYEMMKEAFMGGYTHANRYFVGDILEDCYSMDRSSSYPHVQTFCKFPISKFQNIGSISEKYLEKVKDKKAIIMKAQLIGLKLKDEFYPMPYLANHKVKGAVNAKIDNGKILSCDTCVTTITDVDYWIMKYMYDFDMIILDAYQARYGYLPPAITDLLIEYYGLKTNLKNVDEYLYHKSKNKLNSGYGMTAQDIAKLSILYKENTRSFELEDIDKKDKYEDSSKKAFLPYQWGVWTTALARRELYVGINAVYEQGLKDGITDVIYCDTDSVKYIGDKVDMSEYNNMCIEKGRQSKKMAVHEKTGKEYFLGVFEEENNGEPYKQFITLGAKKYCYVETDGSLHITISGVNKERGAKELGRIENFKEGFIFTKSAGLDLKYNDCVNMDIAIDKQHTLHITDNVYMYESTYTLNIEPNFADLIKNCKKLLDNALDIV